MDQSRALLVTKQNRRRLLMVGCVLALGILALYIYTRRHQTPATPPSAQEIAQGDCVRRAFTDYIKAQNALLQQEESVEVTIARRRLEEQYCLQFARCRSLGLSLAPTSQLFVLAYNAAFDFCLRDEALEKYDAVPSSGD